ncbi:MAG: RNA chaperone Hfq [Acidobacteria bacterium]|nr:RNA chaperone Hfq [Acidobacteriota bacterium]
MVNRKLIRPSLSELREQGASSKFSSVQKKRFPPEQTNAEQYYYLKQMSSRAPVVVKLIDGEEIHGIIEWYDKNCIKVNRDNEPNLLIPKQSIKYLFKENEVKGSDENVLPPEEEEE